MSDAQLSLRFDAPRSMEPPTTPPVDDAGPRPRRVTSSLKERSEWARIELGRLAARPVALTITDNRSSVITAREHGRVLALRLHHMFLEGDLATLSDVVRWVLHRDRAAGVRLDAFVAAHRHLIRRRTRTRDARLEPQGRFHDLRAILDEVELRYLGHPTDARITWGRRSHRRKRRRSIQLGSYVREDRLIRVHRALDAEWVPRFFVESVVYHELLHHELPAERVDGRRRVHTPEFRRREALFERHAEALAFERDHLGQLLRA